MLEKRIEKPIEEFEVIDHGREHEQYFQGCGIAFTRFTDVATGCGMTYPDAYNDALESLAQAGFDVGVIPDAPEQLTECPEIPDDWYHYVSIRVR